ncbi:PAS domain-containing protein (plasmid) [Roseivivax marinus]|uniref:CheR family methyltransferase n=1 Tax=Roseivivax marinus TaxID=1379903 RepID=UPI001F0470CF|nr:CheR family methyltransferase [Roseivivax marinus]UMA67115.1 PAS domain-containing protein [Roseivivax marinus]
MTSTQELTVVGIGASAGGIEALQAFFGALGTSRRLAFVVVTHMNPDHESHLAEVLARHAKIEVKVAEPGVRPEGGTAYVMPAGSLLRLRDGAFELEEISRETPNSGPIDIFLSSLARDCKDRAVGIVLSGGNSDGTLGIKAIKERGGITMAQASDAAGAPDHPDMPDSALATGLVDFALSVESMPATLKRLVESRASFEALEEYQDADDLDDDLRVAFELLRSHTGHDFSGYKRRTFLRRLARRAQVVEAKSLEDYLGHLRHSSKEVMELYRDLLIGVTRFFRDAGAFEALEREVIPELFRNRASNDIVRVWVPGCATGEEVYTLAILLNEAMDRYPDGPRAQIFATDIDEPALAVARAGRYPEEFLATMAPERLERFFTKDGMQYVVTQELRDLCIFSPHSVISDPPFARMDLLSCRNLLIYFGRDLQDQVIPTFHYALKPGGFLFLGTSESISRQDALFSPVDRQQRIFRSRENVRSRPGVPIGFQGGASTFGSLAIGRTDPGPSRTTLQLRQRVEMQVLDRHAPPHVVVDRQGEIIYYSARVGRLLEIPRGAPSRQLLDMAPRQLRHELTAVLREAIETGLPAHRRAVLLGSESDGDTELCLTVEPIHTDRTDETVYLTLFTPAGGPPRASGRGEHDEQAHNSHEVELREMRERMNSTIEEYETALEELKSSNEELVSANEEAQSANEELEASKEEMETLNEELSTTNTELTRKLDELDRAYDDMRNLYAATEIACVFLDRDLVIRNFTPDALSFFNLRENDVGRPLSDLSSSLRYPEFKSDLDEALAGAETVERRLQPEGEDCHFLVRIMPYRDGTGQLDGLVVTLVDMTNLGRAEERQRILIDELNHRVKNILSVVMSVVTATLRNSTGRDSFGKAIVERLQGMARTYKLLAQREWHETPLRELVEQECYAHDPDRFEIEGPDIQLSARRSLPVGLTLHELATNAAKYGALANGTGRVQIDWSVDGDMLSLEWREVDGPAAESPEEDGFGWQLIAGQVDQLEGEIDREFRPDGLSVYIRFPIRQRTGS